ncbi:hydantoinase/oxoprolinase family protein, partial [Candidatus Bathyarchaeota archaeon]|nr:hydantoinase/oxoprolinase family protein [Candidatus Bathyarchaeota archaeon]
GTTAKAGTIRGRVPEVVSEYEVAGKIHMGRLIKGSGYPVRFPFIDLAECSAGGGTIARVKNEVLEVGPTSAGAIPGPACYGRGGAEPTITDANLLLGRLNKQSLLDGSMEINVESAERAFIKLTNSLGLSQHEAAISVILVANSMMAKILRIVSVERGFDPRNFTLVAFGGAGPMHVCALAEDLEIGKIVIPPNPGMFSALGLLTADLFHDFTSPVVREVSIIDPSELEEKFQEMEEDGNQTLESEGIPEELRKTQRSLDIRYKGQGFELNIPVKKPMSMEELLKSIESFHIKHDKVYGYFDRDQTIEIVNVKLRVIGFLDKPRLPDKIACKGESHDYRDVFFEGVKEWVETPVFNREVLEGKYSGPAVIEQYDSTTIVYPGWSFETEKKGNLILRRERS